MKDGRVRNDGGTDAAGSPVLQARAARAVAGSALPTSLKPSHSGVGARGQVAVDRPGNGHGCRGIGVPPAGRGQAGQRRAVALVAAGPGGHMRGPVEQVALVVVAPLVGQHQVLDGVDAAADPRDEMIGL